MSYIGSTPANKLVTSSDMEDGIVTTVKIANDAATADKIANAVNSAITANTAKTGISSAQTSAITANTAKVTNANHSGEVTGATALTIAGNVVDEANLKISNNPTNGYFLTAQSGGSGGMTWVAPPGGGKILQVKSAVKLDRTTLSNTSFTNISDLSVAITPSASNSKIFINAFMGAIGGNGYQSFLGLARGGTNIIKGDSAGSTFRCTVAVDAAGGSTTSVHGGFNMTFLDSPSSTSEQTYTIQAAVRSGGYVLIGGTSNTTLSYFASGACSIVVMEVSA